LPEKQKIEIREVMKKAMLEHALRELPYEACGVISGNREGKAVKFCPARNELHSSTRYNVHPEDLLFILQDIEEQGHHLWGVFHSHPCSEAYPSSTDIEKAYYPHAYYLILSLLEPRCPVLRAFILGNTVEEIELVIV